MSDELFREVDEEVRQEQYQKLWKRYGIYVASLAVAIVVATIAFVIWRDMQESARQDDSARFIAAAAQEQGTPEAAIAALRELARNGTTGYRFLASLREARLLADAGEASQAVAVFDAVAADDALGATYRDLARLLAVSNGMKVLSLAEVEQRIATIDAPDNPFRFSARELLAVAAIQAGARERAGDLLRANLEDPAAPTAMRGRATELLAAIGLS